MDRQADRAVIPMPLCSWEFWKWMSLEEGLLCAPRTEASLLSSLTVTQRFQTFSSLLVASPKQEDVREILLAGWGVGGCQHPELLLAGKGRFGLIWGCANGSAQPQTLPLFKQ